MKPCSRTLALAALLMVFCSRTGSGAATPSTAQGTQLITFSNIGAALPRAYTVAVSWADFDNDGDLDLVVLGGSDISSPLPQGIYRNDGGGTFTHVDSGLLTAVGYPTLSWGDYDNDGYVDLALGGVGPGCRIYHNNGSGTFTDIAAGLPAIGQGSVAWGDYDNDGRLDLAITGGTSRIYHNNGNGTFTDVGAGLPDAYWGTVAWGDYDNDGRLDLLLTGNAGTWDGPVLISRVYRNDGGGTLTDISAGLPGVWEGSAAWGDFDNDGRLDLVLTGNTGSDASPVRVARVFHNECNGTFTDIGAGLPGVSGGPAVWGDYDNDGYQDLLLGGYTGSGGMTRVYHNNGDGTFTSIGAGLPAAWYSSAEWGDYDNDGRLDILLAGTTTGDPSGDFCRIYQSSGGAANSPPNAPSGLNAELIGNQLTLRWNAASDAQTPAASLSYNLRVGTTPGRGDVCAAMASSLTGYRRVVRLGNAQLKTSWTLTVPTPGTYYWSVQAIDGAFAGSSFAGEVLGVGDRPPPALSFEVEGRNPAIGPVRLSLVLPERAQVQLGIFDVSGRQVARLADGELEPGRHEVIWGPTAPARPAGVYLARLRVGHQDLVRRVILLK
jgi:hypothetical protein